MVNLFNSFSHRHPIKGLSGRPAWPAHRAGQAIVEYVVVTGILMATFLILTLFINTFRDYGTRVLDMVAADYP